jgi:hypothetical protein
MIPLILHNAYSYNQLTEHIQLHNPPRIKQNIKAYCLKYGISILREKVSPNLGHI